jgi:exodeoxyribonuclease VII large subunit
MGPLSIRLASAMKRQLESARGKVSDRAGRLDALSPLAVLGRGYAIVTTAAGRAVRRADEVEPGAVVTVRLARGRLGARVTKVDGGEQDGSA